MNEDKGQSVRQRTLNCQPGPRPEFQLCVQDIELRTRGKVEDVVSGAHAGSPVVVQRDDDEHEALRMKRGPADEEHQHHGH